MKRVTALAMLLVMILCSTTVSNAEAVESGNCGAQGSNVTWTLYSDGSLLVSGYGEMDDYSFDSNVYIKLPPYYYLDVTKLTITQGITKIGNCAFTDQDIKAVTIPEGVRKIGDGAFCCTSLRRVTIPASVTVIEKEAFYGCDYLTDVYYTGSPDQWKSISIGTYNRRLKDAIIHYNYNGTPDSKVAKGKSVTVSYKKLKKANRTIKRSNAMLISGAKRVVNYRKVSGNRKITINRTTGKITVKKGLRKGKYNLYVKVKGVDRTTSRVSTQKIKVVITVK